MRKLNVDLGDRSYPIFIGQGLLSQPQLISPYVHGKEVLIVTNTTLAPLYLEQTQALFANYKVNHLILPDGEVYKNLEQVEKIFTKLLELGYSRKCTLVALGGGVIGDTVGFAAAAYQRGVNFIQIPTTLLSQVDSSVGGKTGVNHPLGKNMIGAFHQPQAVIIDMDTLSTLPQRELHAGLAEVYKYGLIVDAPFFAWCESHVDQLMQRDLEALATAIEVSCRTKAQVVSEDETESGKRALLNLGHTFGHAIETAMGYGNWLHGEAIAAGMVQAADLSRRLGWLEEGDVQRIRNIFVKTHLPVLPPQEMTPDDFLGLMARDKKVIDGALRLVLLRAIGDAIVTADYPTEKLIDTLNHR